MVLNALFIVISFLGAFLLFQIQPLMAKVVLPWFGGAPAVWSTCAVFFQLLLLAGYGASHLLCSRAPFRRQLLVYLALIVTALATIKLYPSAQWKPSGSEEPVLLILQILFVHAALPYFTLSLLSPLLQSWFSRRFPGRSPYVLYAYSNIGSFLGLLSYPLLVEPRWTIEEQTSIWTAVLLLLGISIGALTLMLKDTPLSLSAAAAEQESGRPPGKGIIFYWGLLACLSTTFMLALTNFVCSDIAVIPLLWVIPLSIYLLTYVVAFSAWQLPRWPLLIVSAAVVATLANQGLVGPGAPIGLALGCSFAAVGALCLALHTELARSKPAPRYLTNFYFALSAGGAAGGIFVGIIAPHIFNSYDELPLSIIIFFVLVLVTLIRDRTSPFNFARHRLRGWTAAIVSAGLILYVGGGMSQHYATKIVERRNFFGVLRVLEENRGKPEDAVLSLVHGRIVHGTQRQAPEHRREATTYFGPNSAFDLAFGLTSGSPRNIGAIGLGAGTIAAYGAPGDKLRFFEIDPNDVEFAQTYFTFIKDSPAAIEIALGDGRISFEREPADRIFNLIMIDAFTGDAIPVHLLTAEAFELYLRHLTDDGLLLIHISNLHVDLVPVMKGLAAKFNLSVVIYETPSGSSSVSPRAAVFARDPAKLDIFRPHSRDISSASTMFWTDRYTSLWPLLH